MKLSKIYSNKGDSFKDIIFNEQFNVIFGDVKKPEDRTKDSHNLGKTLLISLIEFLMLKKIQKNHFLKKHEDKFKGFEFYLEIKLNSGEYLTIKRAVEDSSKISFKKHKEKNQDFRKLNNSDWDHFQVPFEKSKELLDALLGLMHIQRWNYRKGISYFLRGQNDYNDVFQIEKFSKGDDVDWKPYIAKILGLNYEIIEKKYFLDEEINKKSSELDKLQNKISVKTEDYDRLKGIIEIKESEVEETEKQIERFNFYKEELNINKNIVEEIEENISFVNNAIYNLNYDISKIEESLAENVKFNLEEIKEIFDQSKIYFSEQLSKSYEELIEFNKQVYAERRKYLKERLLKLKEDYKNKEKYLSELNIKRSELLEFIRGEDTFKKFKYLQNNITNKRAELIDYKNQMQILDSVLNLESEMQILDDERNDLIKQIKQEIKEPNEVYRLIRKSFSEIIKHILNQSAMISIKLNKLGNLEFNADIVKDEKTLETTSEGEGTSWKKILCVAFDLAVLRAYCDKEFFRFVYHDGVLEGLDNRKKKNFIEIVKDYSTKYNIQYILTAISDDLPRESDKKIEFVDDEVICRLDDSGDGGRLFKIPKF